jgi:hypothetical protein
MGDRRFDSNAGFVHGPLQPSLGRAEQDGAQSTPALQRDPIDQVTCRAGDNSCATAHASTINRATALQPGRAEHSLLQLQRQYGNRYVERVLSLAREEEKKKKQLAMRIPEGPGFSRQKQAEQEVLTNHQTDFSGNGRVPLPLSVAPPCIQRKAQFVKSAPIEEVNPAEQIAENKIPEAKLYLGKTDFLLNGVSFTEASSQTMINALNKPQIGHAGKTIPVGNQGKTVQGVECWFASEPVNQGGYQMKLLKQGSWTHVTEKKNVGGRFPSLKKCKDGFGAVNFIVRGEPKDGDLRDRVKAHEKHHADDDEALFNDLLGTWDKKVTKAYNDKSKTIGSNLTTCEKALYLGNGKDPSEPLTNLAQGIVKKAGDFHGTKEGAKPNTQPEDVDSDCTVVKVRTG